MILQRIRITVGDAGFGRDVTVRTASLHTVHSGNSIRTSSLHVQWLQLRFPACTVVIQYGLHACTVVIDYCKNIQSAF